jgi:aspartyl-tRNA(Asn)/glutamyl-tRNA(Gln) amidotransferase subunit B
MEHFIKGQTGLWEVVIGLEVHAQVSSKAKLFSGASAVFGADPNTHVTYLDAGMPGMLPVLNKFCVDQAIKTGLGINATVKRVSIFDRKNYFYADLPLGYQISQLYYPIVTGGYIDIDSDNGKSKRINVTRLHLEQDAGKSTHDLHPSLSYIDFNRAGVALMEIVSEPEINSSQEAMAYVKKLRSILRYLGTCDGNMEQGSLRVDANISLHKPGTPFGTRAEIKNVNSVRFLGQAIEYEIARQLEIIESGGVIVQETRLFDPSRGETRSLRSKEDAMDYRYFPDPDLRPVVLDEARIEAIRINMPELPDAKRERFIKEFALSEYDANVLVAEKEVADFYEQITAAAKGKGAAKLIANWLIVEVFAAMNRDNKTIDNLPFAPNHLAELVDLIIDDTISGKIAKDVFAKMWESGKAPAQLVEELGLKQVSDTSVIEKAVDEVIAANATQVEQYRAGKQQVFGFLVGQVMKALQGKANPGVANQILKDKLGYSPLPVK